MVTPPGSRLQLGGSVPQKEKHAAGCGCRICRRVRKKKEARRW